MAKRFGPPPQARKKKTMDFERPCCSQTFMDSISVHGSQLGASENQSFRGNRGLGGILKRIN